MWDAIKRDHSGQHGQHGVGTQVELKVPGCSSEAAEKRIKELRAQIRTLKAKANDTTTGARLRALQPLEAPMVCQTCDFLHVPDVDCPFEGNLCRRGLRPYGHENTSHGYCNQERAKGIVINDKEYRRIPFKNTGGRADNQLGARDKGTKTGVASRPHVDTLLPTLPAG